MNYEDRVVLFIDVLGFRNRIHQKKEPMKGGKLMADKRDFWNQIELTLKIKKVKQRA